MTAAPYTTVRYTLIIYIGDGEGNIEDSGDGQWKTRRNGDDRWEMEQGQRRSTGE